MATALPCVSMVSPGTWMLEVGLSVGADHVLPNPPRMPPAWLLEARGGNRRDARCLAADGARAGADLGLHRVDAHERVRDIRIQPVKHRLAQAGGTPVATTVTRRSSHRRRARAGQFLEFRDALGRTKNGFW
jgi:hypothetical protein